MKYPERDLNNLSESIYESGSTQLKSPQILIEEINDGNLLYVICDVRKNREMKKENIFQPTDYFFKEDADKMKLIQNLINLVRYHYRIDLDDEALVEELLGKLNFDPTDIFLYLSDPSLYSSKLNLIRIDMD